MTDKEPDQASAAHGDSSADLPPWLNDYQMEAWAKYRDARLAVSIKDAGARFPVSLYGPEPIHGAYQQLVEALQTGLLRAQGSQPGVAFAAIPPVEWSRLPIAPFNPKERAPYDEIRFASMDAVRAFPPLGGQAVAGSGMAGAQHPKPIEEASFDPLDREKRLFWAQFWKFDQAVEETFKAAGRNGSASYGKALVENAEIEIQKFVFRLKSEDRLPGSPSSLAIDLLTTYAGNKSSTFGLYNRMQGNLPLEAFNKCCDRAVRDFEILGKTDASWRSLQGSLDGLVQKSVKDVAAQSSVKAEEECRLWLVQQFELDPQRLRPKASFRTAALEKFEGRITERGFNHRVWPQLAAQHGRDASGAKPK